MENYSKNLSGLKFMKKAKDEAKAKTETTSTNIFNKNIMVFGGKKTNNDKQSGNDEDV